MNQQPSHFDSIARAFTVMEIAQPVTAAVLSTDPAEAAMERLCHLPGCVANEFCLVRDERGVAGFVDHSSEALADATATTTAGEVAEEITPSMMLSADTRLLELPRLFVQRFFYFVLSGNEITHVVSFLDLDRRTMHLALFSQLLELEAQMFRWISDGTSKGLEAKLDHLSPDRRKAISALATTRFKDSQVWRMVECLTFADKREIVLADMEAISRLGLHSKTWAKKLFHVIEKVRNEIAHGGSVLRVLKDPPTFFGFLTQLQDVTDASAAAADSVSLEPPSQT